MRRGNTHSVGVFPGVAVADSAAIAERLPVQATVLTARAAAFSGRWLGASLGQRLDAASDCEKNGNDKKSHPIPRALSNARNAEKFQEAR